MKCKRNQLVVILSKTITCHCRTVQVQGFPTGTPPSQTKVKQVAMRGGLFPILCVNWTVKNPIAPEPTYASHYYYYSTKTTLTVAKKKKTSVMREGSCILEIHLSLYSPFLSQKEFQLHQAGYEKKKVKPGAISNKTHLLTYCSVTFKFCNHKQNVPKTKSKDFVQLG